MLAIIEQKETRSPFDEVAQESLRLKRSLAKENPPIFKQLGLEDDHLIHGDYHNDNFFVDGNNRVSHIFDWEKTEVTAREVELLRSLLFICLQKGDDFMLLLTPETLTQAKWYLASYHETHPVDPPKLAAAIENRRLGNIYSTWVEEEHYLHNNERVDLFMPGILQALRYFAQHKDELTEQLTEMIM